MLTKKNILYVFALALIFLSCNSNQGFDFKFKTISGDIIQFRKIVKPVRIVNFWAGWCEPCLLEIPDFVRLQQEYHNELMVFGINLDKDSQQIEQIKKTQNQFNVNYPLLMTKDESNPLIDKISAIPTTYIVDSLGHILHTFTGYTPYHVFKTEIDHILLTRR